MAADDDWVFVAKKENDSDDDSYYSCYADGGATDDDGESSDGSWTEVNDDDDALKEDHNNAGKDAPGGCGDDDGVPEAAPAAAAAHDIEMINSRDCVETAAVAEEEHHDGHATTDADAYDSSYYGDPYGNGINCGGSDHGDDDQQVVFMDVDAYNSHGDAAYDGCNCNNDGSYGYGHAGYQATNADLQAYYVYVVGSIGGYVDYGSDLHGGVPTDVRSYDDDTYYSDGYYGSGNSAAAYYGDHLAMDAEAYSDYIEDDEYVNGDDGYGDQTTDAEAYGYGYCYDDDSYYGSYGYYGDGYGGGYIACGPAYDYDGYYGAVYSPTTAYDYDYDYGYASQQLHQNYPPPAGYVQDDAMYQTPGYGPYAATEPLVVRLLVPSSPPVFTAAAPDSGETAPCTPCRDSVTGLRLR